MSKETLYSTHIFLFPFKWESKEGLERNRISHFEKHLFGDRENLRAHSKPKTPGWIHSGFQIDYLTQYNEYTYFYDYVREILYDLKDSPLDKASKKGIEATPQLLKHYEYNFTCDVCFELKVPEYKREKPYRLDLSSLTLNLYEMGVGVITFFLRNGLEDQSDPQDILNINQFGRRIFPPFLPISSKLIGRFFEIGSTQDEWKNALGILQNIELATYIRLYPKEQLESFEEGTQCFFENFSRYGDKYRLKTGPFILPSYISCLFSQTQHLYTQEPEYKYSDEGVLIKPVLDDRMFVVSWYGGIEKLQETRTRKIRSRDTGEKSKKPEFYRQVDFSRVNNYTGHFWYQYIFIDHSGPSIENRDMAHSQLMDHTYWRWTPSTYYGVCRYSFVALTRSLKGLGNSAFLAQHIESMYYKMAELVLVQRACVLHFADEVTHLSYFMRENPEKDSTTYKELTQKVTTLYENFLRFTNKVYFREVTAQEQGIEMYNMLQEHMNLDAQVKDLKADIEQLHTYIHLLKEQQDKIQEAETSDRLNSLTILGALFLLPSFILTIYGFNTFEKFTKNISTWEAIGVILGLFGLGISSWFLVLTWRRKAWLKWSLIIIIIVLFFLLVFLPLSNL